MKHLFLLCLKGVTMGIADLIPGISGGTIAFIMGIYEELMRSIKEIRLNWIYLYLLYFFTGRLSFLTKAKKSFERINWIFFIPLGIGILIALLVGSHIISWLLDTYFVETMLFIIGIILASTLLFQRHIRTHTYKELIFAICGAGAGLLLMFLPPAPVNPSTIIIMLAGFIAIFALFLPGISGSYILLIIGLYDTVIEFIKFPLEHILEIVSFGIGAIAGTIVSSRIITYLLKHHHDKTLYVMLGLILGSISLPIRDTFSHIALHGVNQMSAVLFLFVGTVLPLALHLLARKKSANEH